MDDALNERIKKLEDSIRVTQEQIDWFKRPEIVLIAEPMFGAEKLAEWRVNSEEMIKIIREHIKSISK